MRLSISLGFLLVAAQGIASVVATKKNIIWDGRPSIRAKPSDFDDDKKSLYNTGWNKGINQTWSDIVSFPLTLGSLNDVPLKHKPFEVSINDNSIFMGQQWGFRRSELMPNVNNASDATVQDTTTIHLSFKADPRKPLNYTHLYDIIFVETSTYDAHVWSIKTGLAYDGSSPPKKKQFLRLYGYKDWSRPDGMDLLFETPFDGKSWHNFAVTTSWGKKAGEGTIEAKYSKGYWPLKKVVKKTANNADRGGQYHIGVFKHPTGDTSDVANKGYQAKGINEGLIFGGVFIEKNKK
ncbi:hypothetical protein BJ508DRAFT_417799 [Ascobolus immersus RN42]|uniref:Glycoside hydrolase 131 catalytic N-terminal domain-containing protein n=1 Tax=Ascobolus immersus RN42 TaxID=1160509 RepID=A0A3N4HQ76_ASCIM|nr:hypothetical protein BJ508DRAFT_417799 [Ascobolus immersus RN42]